MIGLLNKDNIWLQNIPDEAVDQFDEELYNFGIAYSYSNNLIKPKLEKSEYIEGATPQEIEAYHDQFFAEEISRRQLRLQWQLDGRELSEVDNYIEAMPETTQSERISKITVRNAWNESITFSRKDPLMQGVGVELLGSKQELNLFFNRASQL